jgi:hypothetical protein
MLLMKRKILFLDEHLQQTHYLYDLNPASHLIMDHSIKVPKQVVIQFLDPVMDMEFVKLI